MPKSKVQPVRVSGVYAALATPRKAGVTDADAGSMLDYLDAIVRTGVDGLVLFGSTGEFVHFSIEERMRVLSLAIRRSRVPMLVNVSHSTLDGAIVLAENAIDAGARGLLIMPPYFYRYGPAQLEEFFRHFSRAVDGKVTLFLYHIPFFTSAIPPDSAERLMTEGEFAGIKDSSGDETMLAALSSLHRRVPFTWMAGNESIYVEARMQGADGIVSGVSAAIPELVVALDRVLQSGHTQRTADLKARLLDYVGWLDRFPGTVGIKQTAVVRGWNLDSFAAPPDDAMKEGLHQFRVWLERWIPETVAACAGATAAKSVG